jgi:peptidoglycan/LPS O-acetylase OafA/YrhL
MQPNLLESTEKSKKKHLESQPPIFFNQDKAKPKGEARYEELEAYRGLAALGIVVYYAYQSSRITAAYIYEGTPFHNLFRNLEAGVAWFFVLSGFLIFLPFAKAAILQQNPQSARGFLVRRAIRIVPLYYVAIIVVWTWNYSGNPEQWLALLEHLTFTQTFDRRFIFYIIGPSWLLAVEMLFYFLMAAVGPLAFRVCRKFNTPVVRARVLIAALVVALGASLLYKAYIQYVAEIPESDYPFYFGLFAKLDNFVLGMLIAVWVVRAANQTSFDRVEALLLRLAGAALLLATFYLRFEISSVNLYFHTLSALAFSLVLVSTVLGPRDSGWQAFFSHPFLKLLGLVSYSLYLWHGSIMLVIEKNGMVNFKDPIAFIFSTLLVSGVAIGIGWLSYITLEYPTMLLRHLFNQQGRLTCRYPDQQPKSEN